MTEKDFDKIKLKYNIKVTDPESVRDLLTKELASHHPDKTGGNFPDEQTEKTFHELSDAVAYLDNTRSNQQLIPISSVTEIVKIVSQMMPQSKIPATETLLKNTIQEVIRDHRTGLVFPRFTSASLTVILTFLFLFPKTVTEHPILKLYLHPGTQLFGMVWLTLVCLTALIWIYTYRHEERNKRMLSKLKLASVQNELIGAFLTQIKRDVFTKSQLSEYMERRLIYGHLRRIRGNPILQIYRILIPGFFTNELITPEIIQNTADLLIEKSEKNKLIEKIDRGTFDETYKVIGEVRLYSHFQNDL
ncbi:MAG: hypothetical protein V4553_13650 [Bacteroidota bacterium]